MSTVHANDRKPSAVQYIDTARELVVHTIAYCKKFPKNLTFLLTNKIVALSEKIYVCVVTAQAKFPKSERDIAERRTLLTDALGSIASMDCLLGIAKDLQARTSDAEYGQEAGKEKSKKVSDYGWCHWGDLMDTEERLIKAVLSSDEKLSFEK